jgi:PKD repeat protein
MVFPRITKIALASDAAGMMRKSTIAAACVVMFVAALLLAAPARAQLFRRGGTEFNAVRSVSVPVGKSYTIVVVDFFHHGEIRPDGKNVVVSTKSKTLVPTKVLQLGPGDFCRIAFQTVKNQSEYDIFYGGDPPHDAPPPWTCRDGLLLETRKLKPCDFNRFESVRKAFEAAAPIGADYVPGVFHGHNPLSLKREPFMSRYTGVLDLPTSGVYGFFTSSQDCSFLLVDGKKTAAAPGYHGPMHLAKPKNRRDVELSAGTHTFGYYHAAAGPNAMMVVAWIIDPNDENPTRPTLIPTEDFNTRQVAHLPAGNVLMRPNRQLPEFTFQIAGDMPLPDNDTPLLAVLFRNDSSRQLSSPGVRYHWDFGDGQTSRLPDADHIYLRPGLYTVKFAIRRTGKTLESTDRIYVDRPYLDAKERQPNFDAYLRIIETYDMKSLDAPSLRQVVLAFEAKSLALDVLAEAAAKRARVVEEDPNRRPDVKRKLPNRDQTVAENSETDSERYLAKAVAAGAVAFADDSVAGSDADLLNLARLIGPMAHFRLNDSAAAFQIWQGAANRLKSGEAQTECEIAAADIAVNDMLNVPAAKTLLTAATKHFGAHAGPAAVELYRTWGDYYAAVGDGRSAEKEYLHAEQAVGSKRSFIEQAAWRGAHARSTEEFVRGKQYQAAIEELRAWQREFPAEKLEGYWSLLFARYWAARGQFAQAIAQAERLQAVNTESPYLDQILFLAADCETRRGRKDRAVATLRSLLKDCPGSPLTPTVEKNIALLEKE